MITAAIANGELLDCSPDNMNSAITENQSPRFETQFAINR
jgi:hypothetical protein